MPDQQPPDTGHDAWVLLTIAIADGGAGAGLRDILATGDYINHAIFTACGLRASVARLLQAGLIQENAGRLALAGQAKTFWQGLPRSRRPVLRLWDDFQAFLEAAGLPPGEVEPGMDGQLPALADEKFQQAYEEYLRGAAAHQANPG